MDFFIGRADSPFFYRVLGTIFNRSSEFVWLLSRGVRCMRCFSLGRNDDVDKGR
jgi:hypothetical protein